MRALLFVSLALLAGNAAADASAPAGAAVSRRILRIRRAKLVLIDPVVFARDRVDLDARALRILDDAARDLIEACDCHRPSRILVVGDAQLRESTPDLARARAQAVTDALVARGVDRRLLEVAASTATRHRRQVTFQAERKRS